MARHFISCLLLAFLTTAVSLCSSLSNSPAALENPLFCVTLSQQPKPVRRVLLENKSSDNGIILSNPGEVSSFLASLPINPKHKAAAKHGLSRARIETSPSILSEQQCNHLREWAMSNHRRLMSDDTGEHKIDTVDGCPEYQVEIDRATLENIIGKETVSTLWKLPQRYLNEAHEFEKYSVDNNLIDVGCFIRKYTAATRPFIGFHVDDCDATVNVCLSRPQDHQGGQLLAMANGKVLSLDPRNIGDATLHPWYCCHGVSAVTAGERWSLILFCSNVYPPVHTGFYNKVMKDQQQQKQHKNKLKEKTSLSKKNVG